jgi:hypothetical protein
MGEGRGEGEIFHVFLSGLCFMINPWFSYRRMPRDDAILRVSRECPEPDSRPN